MSKATVTVTVSKELEDRLKALAERQEMPLDEILALALSEHADTWEDHLDTVEKLKEGDDRVQLAVANDS